MTRNRVNHFFIFCTIVLPYLYLPMQVCYGHPVTVEFTAEVTEVSDTDNILEGKVEIGDKITGTYTYDTSGIFNFPPSGITVESENLVFKTDPNSVNLTIDFYNDMLAASLVVYEEFTIRSQHNIMFSGDVKNTEITGIRIAILLENNSQNRKPPHPMIGLLSEELPAIAPNLSDWSIRDIELSGEIEIDQRPSKAFTITGHLISATLIPDFQKVLYVDDDATGTNDGSSWENAYSFLQDAITDANNSDKPVEIRVAQGIYQPDMGIGQTAGDRDASFHLMNQVAIKGGYAGLSGPNQDIQNIQLYKTILTGDLNSDDVPGFVMRSDNSYHVISAIDVDESAYIEGLIITSGNADGLPANNPDPLHRRDDHTIRGGGSYIHNGRPIIKDCTFENNFAYGYGGGLYLSGTTRLFNCNFSGNKAIDLGGAIYGEVYTLGEYIFPSEMVLKNCLMQGNISDNGGTLGGYDSEIFYIHLNCTIADNHSNFEPYLHPYFYNTIIWNNITKIKREYTCWYCDVNDNTSTNHFNINTDPLFAAPGYWNDNDTPEDTNDDYWIEGDYHLKSQAGRWNPNAQSWIQDDVTSLCIDTGDPNSPFWLEPFPNGGYINMGAYGGTSEASKSYFGKPLCETIVAGDINGDCKVDELDMEIMLLHWLEEH